MCRNFELKIEVKVVLKVRMIMQVKMSSCVAREYFRGVFGFRGCIEFGAISLKFRFLKSKQFIWGFEPVKPPKISP